MRPKLVYITADPLTAEKFLRGQLAEMVRRGFDVCVLASPGPALDVVAKREGVTTIPVPIPRAIAGKADLKAVAEVTAVLRRLQPDIVNAGTPKGGLVGMLAAKAAGVPVRIYHLRGLRVETVTGPKRWVLSAAERVTASLSTRIISNSRSLSAAYVAGGFARADKLWTPHEGSANGVIAGRFAITPERRAFGDARRAERGWGPDTRVLGFVGRFTRDKGLTSLRTALDAATAKGIDARLLLVGDHDDTDPVDPSLAAWMAQDPRVHVTGFLPDAAPWYAAIDVLGFPSLREGFPNAVLEASAAGLPVVAYRATGCLDAVVDGVTGALVPLGDEAAFAEAVGRYLADPGLCEAHGDAGRARVVRDFAPERVWEALAGEYRRLLGG